MSYKTEQLEDEEAHKKRLEKEKAAHSRTLWEQLEEQKEKKKAEYDAVTKQIFAPPKALDEEEASYLDGILEQEKARERRRAEEEERELAAFSLARANRDLNHTQHDTLVEDTRGVAEGTGGAETQGKRLDSGRSGSSGATVAGNGNGKRAFPEVKINVKIKRKGKSGKTSEGGSKGSLSSSNIDDDKDSGHKKQKRDEDERKEKAPSTANSLSMLAAYASDEDEE